MSKTKDMMMTRLQEREAERLELAEERIKARVGAMSRFSSKAREINRMASQNENFTYSQVDR